MLFLCTHNSARSQMAEGLLRHLAGDRFEAHSAGTEATHVRPLAIRAMAELGVDISAQSSKTLERYLDQPFDLVITVCDQANESCPVFPGARQRLHWSFPDPSQATGTEAEQLAAYRQVRDAIQARIEAEIIGRGDAALLERLLAGRAAFLGYLRQRVDDPELAEDLLQQSLLRAVRAAPTLRDDERLLPWFYRVLQNAVVDAYRRRGVQRARLPTVGLADAGDLPEPSAEHEAVVCACFRSLLPALKPEYAELIEALDLGGEAPDAAAARLGITPNNLKVRRHRARQALRRQLEAACRTCATHHCLDCTCQPDEEAAESKAV